MNDTEDHSAASSSVIPTACACKAHKEEFESKKNAGDVQNDKHV
jgi:hypothetical protein